MIGLSEWRPCNLDGSLGRSASMYAVDSQARGTNGIHPSGQKVHSQIDKIIVEILNKMDTEEGKSIGAIAITAKLLNEQHPNFTGAAEIIAAKAISSKLK